MSSPRAPSGTDRSGSAPERPQPTIDRVLDEFLAEQRERLSPRTVRKYESVVAYLRHHLNGYGYESLAPDERAFFERHCEAEGGDGGEFCRLFGPDKIVEELEGFLGHFMIRKVLGDAAAKKAAGTVVKKLSKWLAAKGYVTAEVGVDAAQTGAAAARDLPRAERAGDLLFAEAARLPVDPIELADEDYLEFEHHRIVKIEPGTVWLEVYRTGPKPELVPVKVSRAATSLLEENWTLSCALGRVRGAWRIVEMGNVYP
jgi:hypothetical protein